jgi:tetratricopeptide (TPR) repeat protein
MSAERLQQLRSMLLEEPKDAFIRYAIALELKREGLMEQAATALGELLTEDPKYIACYYQLALLQAELGSAADALHTCEAGSLQCLATGDRKARAELMELKNAIGTEE